MKHSSAKLCCGRPQGDAENSLRVSLWRSVKPGLFLVPLFTLLLAGQLTAGSVQYQVADLGSNVFRYEFFPVGLGLMQFQDLDVQFDAALFGGLLNGVADSDFRLVVLQPNNPLGAPGSYSALALIDNPSLAGPFSVDVNWLGSGTPGSLPFFIHQFDASGRILETIGSGSLEPVAQVGAPEPSSWLLGGLGLVTGGLLRKVRPPR
jgi:hypothetical protein